MRYICGHETKPRSVATKILQIWEVHKLLCVRFSTPRHQNPVKPMRNGRFSRLPPKERIQSDTGRHLSRGNNSQAFSVKFQMSSWAALSFTPTSHKRNTKGSEPGAASCFRTGNKAAQRETLVMKPRHLGALEQDREQATPGK